MVRVCTTKSTIKGEFMDDAILITELNDFIFCPISIYFHKMYNDMERIIYQNTDQINGTAAHEKVDDGTYSTKKSILKSIEVYCEKYNLRGKIDLLDVESKTLRERKKKVKTIYDGYVFQVYAQYFALIEMGYIIEKIEIYSMDDHKTYKIPLPSEDALMFGKFEKVIQDIRTFDMGDFIQTNVQKCQHCIYEPACDRTLLDS